MKLIDLSWTFLLLLPVITIAQDSPVSSPSNLSNADIDATIDFNNKLANVVDSLYIMGQEWGDLLSEAMDEGDYSILIPGRKEMERFVDRNVQYLAAMKDVGDSKEFRESMIDLLHYEKDLITKTFVPFEKLNENSSSEEEDALLDNLDVQGKNEEIYMQTMRNAQNAYAARNGFTLDNASDK